MSGFGGPSHYASRRKAGFRRLCIAQRARNPLENFLQGLKDRGSQGVQLLVGDDLTGLGAARRAVLTSVPWQRCQFYLQQYAGAYAPR